MTAPSWSAFLLARVSTDDRDQNPETQLIPLREWGARAKDTALYGEGYDMVSGTIALAERDTGAYVLDLIESKKVNLLVTYNARRLSREEPLDALATIRRLKAMGCEWCSATEGGLDTRLYRLGSRDWHRFELMLYLTFWASHDEVLSGRDATTAGLRRKMLEHLGDSDDETLARIRAGIGRHKHGCGVPRDEWCPCERHPPHLGAGPCPTEAHGLDGKVVRADVLQRAKKRRRRKAKSRRTVYLTTLPDSIPPVPGGT